jgi:hypothetical protein
MAKRASNLEHRTMLTHIAESWERIVKSLQTNGS